VKTDSVEKVQELIAPVEQEVREAFSHHVFAIDNETMEDVVDIGQLTTPSRPLASACGPECKMWIALDATPMASLPNSIPPFTSAEPPHWLRILAKLKPLIRHHADRPHAVTKIPAVDIIGLRKMVMCSHRPAYSFAPYKF
jgi:hypothetical protein